MPKHAKRALFSLAEKDERFLDLALSLAKDRCEIYATPNTLAELSMHFLRRKADAATRRRLHQISFVTGFRPARNQTVMTLSPYLHAALRTKTRETEFDGKRIRRIDLVCVSLKEGDVGGLALIKGALEGGKIVVTDPELCDTALDLARHGNNAAASEVLAQEALMHMLASVSEDAKRFVTAPPAVIIGRYNRDLRYGENPDQTPAVAYTLVDNPARVIDPLDRSRFEAIEGEETSFTNETDFALAEVVERIAAVYELNLGPNPYRMIAVIGKHNNPCGAAVREATSPETASAARIEVIKAAVEGDPTSAFGGIIATNFSLGEAEARAFRDTEWDSKYGAKGRPYDLVLASAFTPEAIEVLGRKGGKAKLFQNPLLGALSLAGFKKVAGLRTLVRHTRGEFLTQPFPSYLPTFEAPLGMLIRGDGNFKRFKTVRRSLMLAWAITATTKSNAVSIVWREKLIGNGVGAVSRLLAAEQAKEQLRFRRDIRVLGAQEEIVAASDGFFPFEDGPERLIEAGARTILAPAGSIRDDDVSDACARRGTTLVFLPKEHRSFSGHG